MSRQRKYKEPEGPKHGLFNDLEEMKWYYHRKYVRNAADWISLYLMEHTHTVEEANEALATFEGWRHFRVKEEEKHDADSG